jgi:DNA-binding protein Fis
MEPPGQEIIKKIRTLNFDLPLIVLSKESVFREKEKAKENYKVVPPPFQMEKIASLVKETLPVRTPGQEQKILQGSVRLPSQKKEGVMLENNPGRAPDNPHSSNQDYHHIFARTLEPIFDQIIQNCRGHVYDRLLSGLEKTMLSEVLKHVNHNQVRASQLLGISRNTLRERMKRYDIF